MLLFGAVGIADSLYLTYEELNPQIPIYCPSSGIINCGYVTTSSYSHFFGIPVAIMGLAWFVVMTGLYLLPKDSALEVLIIPVWVVGVLFVVYLASTELFILNSICPYCTLAHVLGIAMGIPALKSALG
jgi:uncharacterized membrane protein